MVDILDANGLQVKTKTEIVTELEAGFKDIYGDDISIEQNSPDGQAINIYAQGQTDTRELIVQLYNSFDPDNASGRLLDQRCNINNVFRKGGSFTTIDLEIVVDREVTLQGLDENYNNIEATSYTVQDNAGNQFFLINTQTFQAGTHTANFRAQQLGRVEVSLNTITTPVTIVLGVVSVNNPTAPIQIGVNEESDTDLKIRRRQSIANGSAGYLNGLLGNILNLEGVTDAALYENYTDVTDDRGIPPHCIWLIVEGGNNADIANTMYLLKSYGCNMKGGITYTIITPSYVSWTARWDESMAQPLYIRFNLKSLQSGVVFNQDAIKQYIIDQMSYRIGGFADTSTLTCIAQAAIDLYGGNGRALDVQVSTDSSTWTDFLQSGLQAKFAIANIDITVI